MFALEVSSAGGESGYGGVPGAIRNLVGALLAADPGTLYHLCARLSRWRKGQVLRLPAPNARVRVIQDPLNDWILRGDRLFHSMGIFLPSTPRRMPKLLTVHDLNAVRNTEWVSEHWHQRRSNRIRRAVERADHVVTYSRFTAGEVCEEYRLPDDRVHPIHLGVDTSVFRAPDAAEIARVRSQHGDYVLAVGLLTPRKNFPALVEAIAPLRELRLVHVGRASDGREAFDAALERWDMRERTTRLEGIDTAQLCALFAGARAYAVPSLYEGFGLTVLEAMACDVPVVCSHATSLPEVAGDAALLVDAADPEALRDALARVTQDSALAEKLRSAGLERARVLSWKAAAHNLRALYAWLSADGD